MSLINCHMNEFLKEFEADNQNRIKAGQTAVKVEGFRLMRLLQSQVKTSSPGGKTFSPMTEIAKSISGSAIKHKNKPLYNLYKAIRYNAAGDNSHYKVEIGATDTRRERLSQSWKNIFTETQQGVVKQVTDSMRKRLIALGETLKEKRGKAKGRAKFFFLKPTTTQFKTPARDIIDTFLNANESNIMPNIRSNFERKIRGERI